VQFRTFGWIARQNPNIRMNANNITDDKKYKFPVFEEKSLEVPVEDRKAWFKKGSLWPTLILVEKRYEGSIKTENAFIRIYRHEDGAILDVLTGLNLDDATLLAIDFKVPLFSVTCSRKGTRGTAQRIHMDIL
jgi:hypothetical protein